MTAKTLEEIATDDSELEMTSMIDVTFLLLIFFMCTLKFKTLEGKLAAYLPKDVGNNPVMSEPIEKVEVRVAVLDPGARTHPDGRPYADPSGKSRFVYDATRRIEYRVGTRRTENLDELGLRLREVRALRRSMGSPEVPVTVDALPGTIYADVVGVVDQALAAGLTDITFVGERPAQ
ncbi:MAG: biopolymer transporter ExbD [bacterium]|nr:biopolymer transporter ExbD [bacterium]